MSNHRCFYSKENCIHFCTLEAKTLADKLLECQQKNIESPSDDTKHALYEAECAWRAFVLRAEACATQSHRHVIRKMNKN